jgi:hypothetical protein
VVWARRATRHAAGNHREAQYRGQRRSCRSRDPGAARDRRDHAALLHAGRLRRLHGTRDRQMGKGHSRLRRENGVTALGREDRSFVGAGARPIIDMMSGFMRTRPTGRSGPEVGHDAAHRVRARVVEPRYTLGRNSLGRNSHGVGRVGIGRRGHRHAIDGDGDCAEQFKSIPAA